MAIANESELIEIRLNREMADRLYWGGTFYALIAAPFNLVLGPGRTGAWILTAALAILGVLRTYAARRVRGSLDSGVNAAVAWLYRVTVVQGVLVGCYTGWVLYDVWGDTARESTMLVVVAGITSVNASLFAPKVRLATLQLAIQLLPAYSLPTYGLPRYGPVLPTLMVLHVIAMIQLVRMTNRHVRRMFAAQVALESRSDDLRQARDAAEQASSARMRFLANMSHEIRTPLNGAIGLAQVLEETPLNEEQRQVLADMQHSGEHLLAVVNDILDMSKVNSGKLVLERVTFDLPALIHDAAAPPEVLAESKGLEFQVIADNLPAHVEGDPVRLRQIISNLLSNAVKFTDKGRVKLTARVPRPGWVQVMVEDTGIGMSIEQIHGLFQEFHQVDSSTTRRFGGTGLGLAISHRLAELMHGRFDVRSEPGAGSIFSIEIPLPEAASRNERERGVEPAVALPPDLRVLVAEDNAVNRTVIERLLRHRGLAVDVVENGRLAVERHRASPYDIILMDCQMPEMDGYEATACIRALAGAVAKTPIVGVTAGAFREDGEKCLRAGMDGYVPKPIDRNRLLTTMAGVLPHEVG